MKAWLRDWWMALIGTPCVIVFMYFVIKHTPPPGGMERFERGGHFYLKEDSAAMGPKPFIHDPDCPCGKGG